LSKTVKLISLGCSKNLVDSEVMLGLLSENGYTISLNEVEADIIIINTCAFIEDAKQESIDTILEFASAKKANQKLIVTGCLAQRYADELSKEVPEINAIVGTGEFQNIVDICNFLLEIENFDKHISNQISLVNVPQYLYNHSTPRIITTPLHYAYIKVAEGCNKRCTFCAIPMMRGTHRSRSIDSIIFEAKSLVEQDVKEILLISQDLTYYGIDQYGKAMLSKLLSELVKIEGLEWIRLMYTYPSQVNDELLEIIAREPKICNYLDMPIQHIDSTILRRMNRKTSPELIRAKIEQIRETIPEIFLRTTLLVGFPGETEKQFEQLVNFVKEAEFYHLGIFAYSLEEGTPAASFEKQLPIKIKKERLNYLSNVQSEIAIKKRKKMIGVKANVLVDAIEGISSVARIEGQAPEIDDVVYIEEKKLPIGEFVPVQIKSTEGFDLIASIE